MIEKFVSSDRGKTFYWTSSGKNSLTLFFLPGLTADHRLFEKQLAFFQGRYNLIVWDCPCHGKSRPYRDFSYAHVAEEFAAIIRKEDVKQVVLIGQSLGGMIAQYLIDSFPELIVGLVAIDSAPFGNYYSRSDFFWLSQLEWMCRLFPDKLLRKSMAWMCGKTAYARQKMTEMLSIYSFKELCHLMYIGEAAFIPENKEINITCKVILLLGEKDQVGKVAAYNREWAKRAGIPLFTIEGAAHNSQDDRPDEVNRIIEEFLAELEQG